LSSSCCRGPPHHSNSSRRHKQTQAPGKTDQDPWQRVPGRERLLQRRCGGPARWRVDGLNWAPALQIGTLDSWLECGPAVRPGRHWPGGSQGQQRPQQRTATTATTTTTTRRRGRGDSGPVGRHPLTLGTEQAKQAPEQDRAAQVRWRGVSGPLRWWPNGGLAADEPTCNPEACARLGPRGEAW